MNNRKKPNGYVATCQCGIVVGAIDFVRTLPKDASLILTSWIRSGCLLEPRFDEHWTQEIASCKCEAPQ